MHASFFGMLSFHAYLLRGDAAGALAGVCGPADRAEGHGRAAVGAACALRIIGASCPLRVAEKVSCRYASLHLLEKFE